MRREVCYGIGLISFFAIAFVMLRQSTMLENYTSEIYDGNFEEIEKSQPLENIEFDSAPTSSPQQVQFEFALLRFAFASLFRFFVFLACCLQSRTKMRVDDNSANHRQLEKKIAFQCF
jgi:hypothetical protein